MEVSVAKSRFKDKALVVYVASGLVVGAFLATLLHNPILQSLWYEQTGFPRMPRCPYWIANGVGMMLAVVLGTAASTRLRIFRALSWSRALRGVAGVAIVGAAIPVVACPFTSLSMAQWTEEGDTAPYVVLGPLLVALLISVGLLIATRRWYTVLACALPVAGVLGLFVGSLISAALELHDASSMAALGLVPLLALVCGFWIRAAERDQTVRRQE